MIKKSGETWLINLKKYIKDVIDSDKHYIFKGHTANATCIPEDSLSSHQINSNESNASIKQDYVQINEASL